MSICEITPQQAKKLLDENPDYVYLDVRTEPEFEAGRTPGAINIPLIRLDPASGGMAFNSGFVSEVGQRISRTSKVIVGCQSGGRSAKACEILSEVGYDSVVNMAGGFGGVPGPGGQVIEPGWSTLGYPIETGDAGERSFASLSKPQ